MTHSPLSIQRIILTQVGSEVVTFPSEWVGEILTLDRTRILPLPFYSPSLVGVVHDQGQVFPLISLALLIGGISPTQEQLNVIRLHQRVPDLGGAGLIVDRILGAEASDAEEITASDPSSSLDAHLPRKPFEWGMIPTSLWMPSRWQPLN